MQSEMAARTAAAKRDGTPRRRSKKYPKGTAEVAQLQTLEEALQQPNRDLEKENRVERKKLTGCQQLDSHWGTKSQRTHRTNHTTRGKSKGEKRNSRNPRIACETEAELTMGKDEMKPNGKRSEREIGRIETKDRGSQKKKGGAYVRLSKAEKRIGPHIWDRMAKKFE